MSDDVIKGPVNGATIKVKKDGGEVYWTWSADDNMKVAFRLYHTEPNEEEGKPIATGTKPSAQRIDFGLNGLDADTLAWEFKCSRLNEGTFPLWVQFWQGTQASGYKPISKVIEYDIDLTSKVSIIVEDFIVFEEKP